MPIVADGAVAMRADMSKFNADLKKAEGPVQSLGGKIQSALSPQKALAGLGAGLAGMFAASKVVEFLGDTISAASNMNETLSKTSVILGEDALPALEDWAESAADAFGLSKQAALDAVSTFAIFGKSAGLAGQELAGFSTGMAELASDLASFFNTSPEDAITAIGAALRGESEPIRRYGVLLDEATLRQRALKLGIIDTINKALTPQQRVLAAQAEIFAQTSDAQGDFARTSDGLANQQRILAAQIENVKVKIGDRLLPVVLELMRAFVSLADAADEYLGPALDAVGWVIGKMVDGLKQIAGPLIIAKDLIDDLTGAAEASPPSMLAMERGMNTAIRAMEAEAVTGTDAIVTEFEELPGEMADAMLANQFELSEAMAELVQAIEEGLTPAQERAEAAAFLASDAYIIAVESGKPAAIAKWNELATEALAVLANPNVTGIVAGANKIALSFAAALASGLDKNLWRIDASLGRYAGKMIGFSPPKEGPLKDIDKGGYNIATAWLDGFNLGLGGDLKLPGMPGVNGGGSLGPMAGGASTVNNTWNLTIGGVPYQLKTRDDFIKALDDVSRFGGEGRLPSG